MRGQYKDISQRSRMGRHMLDWSGSGQGQVADSHEYGSEPSGSI